MASTQHPHSRYHPGPPQRLDSEVRLPSLKDLNFQYRSPQNGTLIAPAPPADPHPAQVQQDHGRHAWGGRQTSASSVFPHPAHQQHSPPLPSGAHHEASQPTKAADYPTQKHDNGGYAHPGLPLSAQIAPASTSFSTGGTRPVAAPPFQDRDKQVHSPTVQTKRPRAAPTMPSASRDARAPHSAYALSQYSSYAQSSQAPPYQPQQQHVPASVPSLPSNTHQTQTPVMPTQSSAPPSAHDQIHASQQPQQPLPATSHTQYSYAPQQYYNSRGSVQQPVAPQQQHHQQPQTSQASIPSSYRSPNAHPAAPSQAQQPPGPWVQQQHHLQQTQHAPPPPTASQIQSQHQQSQQHLSSLQQQQPPSAQRVQQQQAHQQVHVSQQQPPQQPQQQHTIHPHSMHFQPPPGTSLPTTATPYSLIHHTPAPQAPPPLPPQPPQQPQRQPSQYGQQQQRSQQQQPPSIQHQNSQNSQPQQPPPRYEDAPPPHSQHVPQHQQQHVQPPQHAQPPQHVQQHQQQHQQHQQHTQHQTHAPPPPQQHHQRQHQQAPPFPATRSTPIIPTTVVLNSHQQARPATAAPQPQPPHSHSHPPVSNQPQSSAPPPPYVSPGAESMMEVDANTGGGGVNGGQVGVNPNSVNGTGMGVMHAARSEAIAQLNQHCAALYSFASRYANQQHQQHQGPQPSQAELEEMAQRAQMVVRLLEDLRRMNMGLPPLPPNQQVPQTQQNGQMGQVQQQHGQPIQVAPPPEDPRPPKRPWEDISQDAPEASASHHQAQGRSDGNDVHGGASVDGGVSHGSSISSVGGDGNAASGRVAPKGNQSTAEQDMELIRTKRASTTAGATGTQNGVQKSKYRKRSRATPPGKCHSCNIRETPEWRRGPDGARTLCNACGLHYAKLMRKRDKNGGDGPRIDLETLRASARAIDTEKSSSRNKGSSSAAAAPSRSRQPSASTPGSPMDTKEGLPTTQPLQHNQMYTPESYSQQQQRPPQHHHQGSFQLIIPADNGAGSSTGSSGAAAAAENGARAGAAPNGGGPGGSVGRSVSTTNGPSAVGNVPPPPWANSASTANAGGRPTYATTNGPSGTEHLQHQSFVRGGGGQR